MAAEAGQSFVVRESGLVVFGRNGLQSGSEECPEVVFYPAGTKVCQYLMQFSFCLHIITSPFQDSRFELDGGSPFAVILNRTIKTWGTGSGANEKGVTISVSWATNEKELLATDLAR